MITPSATRTSVRDAVEALVVGWAAASALALVVLMVGYGTDRPGAAVTMGGFTAATLALPTIAWGVGRHLLVGPRTVRMAGADGIAWLLTSVAVLWLASAALGAFDAVALAAGAVLVAVQAATAAVCLRRPAS